MNFNFKNGNFDLFHPLILVVMVILFLIIAMPMWYFYRELPSPNLDLYLYIGLGLLFFIFGIYLSNYILKKNFKIDTDLSFKEILSTEKLSLSDSYSKNELILVGLVSFGILLQIINIALLGGIPLFSATLKAKAATKIWLISYIIFLPAINVLLAKYNRKSHYILLGIGLVLFALTGYRTTPIAIMLSALITLYYTREKNFPYCLYIFK